MRILYRDVVVGLAVAMACAGCGSGPVGSDCAEPAEVSSLLRLDCRGRIVSGLARARVDGVAVVLELMEGLDAPAVLNGWPPMDRPPWLGHGPVEVTRLDGGRIRLEFMGADEPRLRLLTDRRLVPWAATGREIGDARDRVDGGEAPFATYDERTVAYAYSLGRPTHREAFDRRYYLILAKPLLPDRFEDVRRRMGREWAAANTLGARRPIEEEEGSPDGCWPVPPLSRRSAPDVSQGSPTVRYPADDPAGRDLAERLVSASLPGRTPDLGLAGLRVRADGNGGLTSTDVAVILPVPVGDVHPCSILGEVEAEANRLGSVSPDGAVRTFPLGESARFRIDPRGMT